MTRYLKTLIPALVLAMAAAEAAVHGVAATPEGTVAPNVVGERVADEARGREIYLKQCIECHGDQGQGVAGKYDHPFSGRPTLEKLTRVIERSMPEEAPEQCVGEDAAAVARYVFEAFYQTAMKDGAPGPRVELARLTGGQYLQVVADLLRQVGGQDGVRMPRGETGLRGEYFSGRGFGRERLVFSRVDEAVDFDFGLESPDPERIGPEEFSVRWRGSLVASDTGDYEFILVTPNGARLWINGGEEPVVDASVVSGDMTEYRARLRLLGGRAYPLRLELFKSKDREAAVALQWKPPHGVRETVPARYLRTDDTAPTWVISTVFPPEDASAGYERGVLISKAWDEATTAAAIEVAQHVEERLEALAGLRGRGGDGERDRKVREFALRWVETALRRRLNEEERQRWVGDVLDRAGSLELGVKAVVLRTLKSPAFLYLGIEGDRSAGEAVAERLSFGLWDSLPDRQLLEAAWAGKLSEMADVRRQATRMLSDARAWAKLRAFLMEWLQVDRADDLAKDPAVFPGFTPEVMSDLRRSLEHFLERVVWEGRSDFRDLLISEELDLNERLARFYGLERGPAPPEAFIPVDAGGQSRAGVLTHPFLLAAFAYPKSTSPIHRGVFLTRHILGRGLRPPPNAIAFDDASFDPGLSMREKVAQLTRPEACTACHAVINPLGFSLENFDAVGRYRTMEGERPVDASSDYTTADGRVIRLAGARDVARFAVGDPAARTAFVEQLFHRVVKQPVLAYGPDSMTRLRESFERSEYDIRGLLVEIATLAACHHLPTFAARPTP